MNRQMRRKMAKKADKDSALYKAVFQKNKIIFKNGTKVRIKENMIDLTDVNSYFTDEYIDFITNCKDKLFTVENLEYLNDYHFVTLKENNKWIWHTDNLESVK